MSAGPEASAAGAGRCSRVVTVPPGRLRRGCRLPPPAILTCYTIRRKMRQNCRQATRTCEDGGVQSVEQAVVERAVVEQVLEAPVVTRRQELGAASGRRLV